MIGKPVLLNKVKKTGRDFQKALEKIQRETYETVIQENKELEKKKVSIRTNNYCSLIVSTDELYYYQVLKTFNKEN